MPPQEDEISVNPITVRFICHDNSNNLISQLRRDSLVRIEDQYPFVLEWKVLQGPVLLLGPAPPVMELNNPVGVLTGDLDCAVSAL